MRDREQIVVGPEGARLHGDRWNGGGPPLVLLHAGVADRRSWYDVAEGLAGKLTVAFDMRGFGESPASSSPYTNVADLLHILDAVADEPAWLVGSSMGGGIALDVALTAPERIAGLVVIAPAVSGAPEPAEMDTDTDALGALLDAAYEAGDLDEISRLEAWIWLDGPGSPEGRVTGASRDLFLEMNRVALANELPENAGDSALEAWDRLAEIEAPTLVICGDLDVPHLLERSRLLPQRLGHARYHEITGMAHLPYLEDAGLITGLVQEALNARA